MLLRPQRNAVVLRHVSGEWVSPPWKRKPWRPAAQTRDQHLNRDREFLAVGLQGQVETYQPGGLVLGASTISQTGSVRAASGGFSGARRNSATPRTATANRTCTAPGRQDRPLRPNKRCQRHRNAAQARPGRTGPSGRCPRRPAMVKFHRPYRVSGASLLDAFDRHAASPVQRPKPLRGSATPRRASRSPGHSAGAPTWVPRSAFRVGPHFRAAGAGQLVSRKPTWLQPSCKGPGEWRAVQSIARTLRPGSNTPAGTCIVMVRMRLS